LAQIKEASSDTLARDEIFQKVIGDGKYGYAKIYSMGVKVPHSSFKNVPFSKRKLNESKSSRNINKVKRKFRN